MIRRPPRSTLSSSSAASDVYKRQARTRLPHGSAGHLCGADLLRGLYSDVADGSGRTDRSRTAFQCVLRASPWTHPACFSFGLITVMEKYLRCLVVRRGFGLGGLAAYWDQRRRFRSI